MLKMKYGRFKSFEFILIAATILGTIFSANAQTPLGCEVEHRIGAPCSDLCRQSPSRGPVAKKFQKRPIVTLDGPPCYDIDAFPMYKPNIRVHVRLRRNRECVIGTTYLNVALQALADGYAPVGTWAEPEDSNQKSINALDICPDEDAFNNKYPPGVQIATEDCPKTTENAVGIFYASFTNLTKEVRLSIDVNSGLCAIWNYEGLIPNEEVDLRVRFIAEILHDYEYQTDEPIATPPYMLTTRSKFYLFKRTGKSMTNLQGCHNADLLTEEKSHLVYADPEEPPTTKSTSTTTTKTTSTTTTSTTTTKPTIITPKITTTQMQAITTTTRKYPRTPTIIKPPPKRNNTTNLKPIAPTMEKLAEIEAKLDNYYEECEVTKRCLQGVNPNCVTKEEKSTRKKTQRINVGQNSCAKARNCDFLISYGKQTLNKERQIAPDEMLIEMIGRSVFWIAMGFSTDDIMGDDFVIECVNFGGSIQVSSSWNTNINGRKGNERMPKSESDRFVRHLDGFVSEGKLQCSFALKKIITVRGQTFSFERKSYKILMAFGTAKPSSDGAINDHGRNGMLYSPIQHNFAEQFGPNEYQEKMVLWHGYIMFTIWILIVPTSNFISRHFKETFQAYKIFGYKLWYFVHVSLMSLGMFLLLVGHALLTEANSTWHSLTEIFADNSNHHLWFALACSSLYFFNFYNGFIINETYRGIVRHCLSCNNIHALIGHLSYICALISLNSAPQSLFANLPCSVSDMIIGWMIIYHVYTFIIMDYHGCWVDWMLKLLLNSRAFERNFQSLFQIPKFHARAESPGSKWRQYNLIIFVSLTVILFITLVAITGSSTEKDACFTIKHVKSTDFNQEIKVSATCSI